MSKKDNIKNVIFIMLDTLQFNYLGCYGNDVVKTPNLDKFAQNGFLFENAYSEGLPTIPVRRAIMTGRFTLPYSGWRPLTTEDTSITDMLWCREVQTALVYDTPPMRLPKYGYSRGFDYVRFCNGHELDHETFCNVPLDEEFKAEDYLSPNWLKKDENGEYDSSSKSLIRETECYLRQRQFWASDADNYASVVISEADNWLKMKRNPQRPFFLWLDSFDPHEPWDPPSMWEKKPCPYDPDYTGNPLLLAPWTEIDGVMTEEECAHIRALYAEKVTLVDKWLGKLFDSLKAQGLWDDTMIVITSDHGQPMGSGEHGHGLMRKCRPWPYEELVHVPLLIRVPGLEGGKRISSFVQNVDITATVVDGLGMGLEALAEAGHEGITTYAGDDMHGISLLPVMRGETDKVRDFAIAGYYGMSWSIIDHDYSYIHWLQREIDTDSMNKVFYDGSGKGGNAGAQSAKLEMKEEMWTCVPGAEVSVPHTDELYDRRNDQFQLKNLIGEQPEKAKELLQKLKLFIGELRTS
ncbi:sulfatase [Nitratidesulfovibrio vulgaris]|jgi:arylsulfatase A-like enzyme|uniref:Sulfatase, putative n=1 Tax=Nitratidesulfovibrio vulgaris (strain ATCC 29579 / DSM 644 / CCUG 34227 / NCIMB 8303 / VKM B-1760 / Hildenborough) TaxID=882 RepID=Q72F35_NITV2|nr:sulfatase [Nitratidesulfovibrio vulgaris]AAS94863.1 sulfatase, putative [Nitratidesulfovibrio vulgaris str. Hildenborough]ADP85515.1 sulfatase [Nitratidesulfovibrio vulgaris RCH1]